MSAFRRPVGEAIREQVALCTCLGKVFALLGLWVLLCVKACISAQAFDPSGSPEFNMELDLFVALLGFPMLLHMTSNMISSQLPH